jgi:hypothetical protein
VPVQGHQTHIHRAFHHSAALVGPGFAHSFALVEPAFAHSAALVGPAFARSVALVGPGFARPKGRLHKQAPESREGRA